MTQRMCQSRSQACKDRRTVGHEAKEWATTVGIEMLEADIIRAVVAGLGVLMKKKQTGCGSEYGVDVLRIAFDALSKATRKLT